jgi:hypothetical protein
MNDIAPLDRQDVAALRAADSVTFHTHKGRAFIKAHKRPAPGRDVYSAREQRLYPVTDGTERTREITADHSILGCESGWAELKDAAAFYMIGTAQFSATWPTIAELIRAGDQLQLVWTADNNSQYITNAGLHADELALGITRGDRTMTLKIGYSVAPDNSARMIDRNG